MAPAKKKPPVTGYRQASDKGRPTKSTPQKRPTSAMPGPRPKTSTRTSNTTGMVSPKPTAKPEAKPAAKPAASRGMTMSGDRGAAIKGAGNPAGPRAPKPSWDQKGNLKRPALPAAGQTSGNRTATRIEGMRNRIIANTAAGKPSGVRTGQPANIKGALPAAGKTGGNQANAAKSARVARMQARRAAEAAAGKPSGVRTGQPAGAANRYYGVNAVNAAVKRAQQAQGPLKRIGSTIAQARKLGVGKLLGRAAVIGGIAEGLNENLNPNSAMNRQTAEIVRRINEKAKGKYGDRFKNAGTGASAAKGAKSAAKPAASTSRFAGARDAAVAKAKSIKGSPVVGPKKPAAKAPSAPARMSAPAARSSAPSAPKATASKASAPKATAPSGPARMSASTYNRVSGNYGTSRSNNPLMADFKDSLPSKAADPDVGYSPKTKVSGAGIKGAPTDVTKLAFSNPKLSAERTRKIKRG